MSLISNLIRRGVFLFLTSASCFTLACGGSGGSSNESVSAQSVESTVGELGLGSVANISFGASTQASVSFNGLTGREQFVLALFSGSTAATSYTATIGSGSESLIPEDEDLLIAAHLRPQLNIQESDVTEDFHSHLREAETALPGEREVVRHNLRSLNAEAELTPELSLGDTRSIKVLNSLTNTSSYTARTGRLIYQTTHFDVYVDSDDQDVLSSSDIQEMADVFESRAEAQYATFGDVSDIDNNQKVNIFYTHVLNGLSSAGIVTGYFFAGDLYDSYASSNNGEFIYCHVPDNSGEHGVAIPHDFFMSNTGPLCLYHELQHAINYNMKVFENNGSPEPGAFNEGRSHLAEDLHTNFSEVSNENPSRVELCLASSALASFANGTGLAQRGCSYLFHLYLYEQAENGRFAEIQNGAELLFRTSNTTATGMDAITEATGESVETLIADFFSAVYLSNTGLSSDSRYNFRSINLRATQDDNRGTELSGPQVNNSSLPSSTSIAGMSAAYFLIEGSDLIEAGNTLRISGSSGMTVGAALIHIGDR